MIEASSARAPGWFKLLAWLGLVWNLIGVATYFQHVGFFGDPLAGMSDAEKALAASVPSWVTGAFAVAVFAGLLGSLALVLMKRVARPLLLLSLLAILVQFGWVILVSDARAMHGLSALAMPALIILIATLLVWLAGKGAARGWLS